MYRLFFLILAYRFLLPAVFLLHQPVLTLPAGDKNWTTEQSLPLSGENLRVFVQGPDGAPVGQLALVILTSIEGQVQEAKTQSGYAEFNHVREGWYDIEIIAPGYERAKERTELIEPGVSRVTVTLRPTSNVHPPTAIPGPPILAPKAKKELGKALEAMRARKLAAARSHLDTVYRLAPGNPDVNYAFGIYCIETNELDRAKEYLEKVVNLDPKHAGALRSLGIVFLFKNTPVEAAAYLKRATESEPTSWRAHALLADASLRLGSVDESVLQAERALELGHGQAEIVQPLLARALAQRGDTERAIEILQTYLRDYPSDTAVIKQLDDLRPLFQVKVTSEAPAANLELRSPPLPALTTSTLFLPSSWLPPDIDEKVPPVESAVACSLDEVTKNAGERVGEFIKNVDRFTATETIMHETINRWGLASSPERLKFDYLVSIEEIRPGLLSVEEFRSRVYSADGFPDGIVNRGLPALLLIFHPYNVDGFDMTCEGLAHWNGALAWQVHFRQRSDRPNKIKSYRLGENGPSYAAALKGRAWIAVDNYQIVRLEMDLVAPLPEIRLVADHVVVEYGPVNFLKHTVEMWLPQTAESYYDWGGHRGHRVHRFTNYLLFSVDDKQRISAPKVEDGSPITQ